MTGRKARVVRNAGGRGAYQLRARPDSSEMDSLNIREKQAFMEVRRAFGGRRCQAAAVAAAALASRAAGRERMAAFSQRGTRAVSVWCNTHAAQDAPPRGFPPPSPPLLH